MKSVANADIITLWLNVQSLLSHCSNKLTVVSNSGLDARGRLCQLCFLGQGWVGTPY